MTIEELNKLYEEHRIAYENPETGEVITSSIEESIENALIKDPKLAREYFSTCTIDFFKWFHKELGAMYIILCKCKNLELFNILKEHISSFNDQEANEYLTELTNDLDGYLK